ncbi:MAG: adenylate kinase [Terriglobia bacterium]
MFGAPGAGKGTQSQEISRRLGIPHISTGDILRDEVRKGTEIGRRAQSIMEAGELVPDDLVCAMVERRIGEPDCQRGFILDGFPRSVHQALFLDGLLRAQGRGSALVVNIRVDQDSLLKRLTGRRMCPGCGTIYNIYFNPPRKTGICDRDETPLAQRRDDTEEAVQTRLREYRRQTKPLIDRYRSLGVLRDVDGNLEPRLVTEAILRLLKAS